LRHLARTTVIADLAGPADGLADLSGVHGVKSNGTRVDFEVDPIALDRVLTHLAGIGVRSLTSRPPTLEELFIRHYQDGA
jgi:ABC-2 type transport system ATP-binding protein